MKDDYITKKAIELRKKGAGLMEITQKFPVLLGDIMEIDGKPGRILPTTVDTQED